MSWKLGPVGHFSVAVIDPEASARWWVEKIGVERQFDFDEGVASTPDPQTLGHMSFRLQSMSALHEALRDMRKRGVTLEDPGDEIGPEAPGSPNLGLWFHDLDGYRWELNVPGGEAQGP